MVATDRPQTLNPGVIVGAATVQKHVAAILRRPRPVRAPRPDRALASTVWNWDALPEKRPTIELAQDVRSEALIGIPSRSLSRNSPIAASDAHKYSFSDLHPGDFVERTPGRHQHPTCMRYF